MCGLSGMVDLRSSVTTERLAEQRDRLKHRGPNGSGLWISPSRSVGLAHRRLSVLDLSNNGAQPMISHNGRYAIVYNGEVYNFPELRKELEQLGHIFKGTSDTEVVLAAYESWGDACLQRFNGMFAIVIHDLGTDSEGPSLFLARDRAGKKPIYYTHSEKHFEFGSELKAVTSSKEIDPQALNFYLALGYVPHDLCLFKRVKKLPAAHAMRVNLRTMELKLWKYWSLPANTPDLSMTGEELADEAERLLLDSVRIRLASDVPLGVLLSGGLDSSLIAAAAARESQSPIQAFTISFPGTVFDEASYATQVAKFLGAQHHILEVKKPSLDVLTEIESFIDEPLADSSLLPSYVVTKLTREHVTVALGGDGGDELFGGYSDYPTSLADHERVRKLPKPLLKFLALSAAQLPAGVRGRNRLASLRHGAFEQMIWGSPYYDVELRSRILSEDQVAQLGSELDAPERWLQSLFAQGTDPVDRMTRTHFGSILPDDFLVKVDRASMMNSLEVRCPLLDYRLIEFAFGKIPSDWKVKGTDTRRIEKILGGRWLPKDLNIQRKQGFSIPLDDWLRQDQCKMMREYSSYLPDMINLAEVDRLIEGHMQGRANGARIYNLLMLAIANKNKKNS